MNARPLEGLRVLEFTWAGTGPMITWVLASMGADVVKVEHRSRPDLLRRANAQYGWAGDDDLDKSPFFGELNSAKRSVAIDLSGESGRRLARRLATKADVVVENMRPGRIERLGLGYDDVRDLNPRVIYCSLSAMGRGTGSPVERPGYAPIFWAEGGGAWLSGWPEADPDYIRSPVDMHAGVFACLGILAALLDQGEKRGRRIDLSASESVAALLGEVVLAESLGLPSAGRRGNDDELWILNDVIAVGSDAVPVALSVRTREDWDIVVRMLPVSIGYEELDDGAARERAVSELTEAAAGLDAATLAVLLREAGVAASVVLSLQQTLHDEGLRGRNFWRHVNHPRLGDQVVAGLPWRLNGRSAERDRPAPDLGGHTVEVLREWADLPTEQISALLEDGVIDQQDPATGSPGRDDSNATGSIPTKEFHQ